MRSASFSVSEGVAHTVNIPFVKPAGTVVAKFYVDKGAGFAETEIPGVVSWDATNVIFTFTAAQTTKANFPSDYRLGLSVNGGAETDELIGSVGLIAAPVTPNTNSIQSGTWNVGQSGSWTVAVGKATTGGLSRFRLLTAAGTNATVVKASAGQVYTIHAYNNTAAAKFLKLYDKATAPVVGTDIPVETYPLPPNAWTRISFSDVGDVFAAGIGLAVTAGIADADIVAVAANDVVVNMHFA